jgi:Na+-transporting NADH:ubiquinone oxidoreductase subunit C
MAERESILRTLTVAGGVALFCSLLVTATVQWLRPFQLAYRSIEQDRAILIAADLAPPGAALSNREIVSRYLALDVRLVDLDRGRYADDVDAVGYDYGAAADDPLRSAPLPRERDIAGLVRRPRYMPVYELRRDGALERLVLPVYGRGMWSTIHGFLALGPDLATVAGVNFYEHGETPGIGDRIQKPEWEAGWIGKRAYDAAGRAVLRIGGNGGTPEERVDSITGATMTVNGVDRIVRFWLGPDGYGPFLAAARAERH